MPHITEIMLGHTLTGVMAVYNKHDWMSDQAAGYEKWWGLVSNELGRVGPVVTV